jgi:uncharacterized membrane protein
VVGILCKGIGDGHFAGIHRVIKSWMKSHLAIFSHFHASIYLGGSRDLMCMTKQISYALDLTCTSCSLLFLPSTAYNIGNGQRKIIASIVS